MEGKKGVGVNKRRPMKRSKNKMMKKKSFLIPGIINFLKSDSYFYSHLISPLSSNSSVDKEAFSPPTGLEKNEPILGKKGNLKERLVEYLKSDTYLYAPMGGTQQADDFSVKTLNSPGIGQQLKFMTVTRKMLSTKISWQTKQMAEDSIGVKQGNGSLKGVTVASPKTPELPFRRSSRLSTIDR